MSTTSESDEGQFEDQDQATDDPPARRVNVPVGRRDMFGEFSESVEADADAADMWDARLWHARPPR